MWRLKLTQTRFRGLDSDGLARIFNLKPVDVSNESLCTLALVEENEAANWTEPLPKRGVKLEGSETRVQCTWGWMLDGQT